jgi:hypothetical protein
MVGVSVRAVAKALSNHEIFSAALDLRKPVWPLYESDDMSVIMEDPFANVLALPIDRNKGSSLSSLVKQGIPTEAVETLLDMHNVSVIIEADPRGDLIHVNMMAVEHKRDLAHHRLLSLPIGVELVGATDRERSIYECCRLAALAYDLSMLFSVLPFSGIKRLVLQVQRTVEMMDSESSFGPGANFFIWVYFVTGAAIPSQSEWFVGRLRALLVAQRIDSWAGVTSILESFLWMSEGMDKAAVDLWSKSLGPMPS